MITEEELASVAAAKGLSIQNAEKDYLLELVLSSIYKRAADKFVFKGGTALYKFYGLNRFSEDLDFTARRGKINEALFNLIMNDIKYIGIKGFLKEYNEFRTGANVYFMLAGPLYRGGKENLKCIAVNISKREQTLEPKIEFFISSYKDIPAFNVTVMQEGEILAEKVRAVLTRDKARDVYDMWFLLKKGISINETLINRKLRIYKLNYHKQKLLDKINKLETNWKSDLQNIVFGKLPDFDEAVKFIKSKV